MLIFLILGVQAAASLPVYYDSQGVQYWQVNSTPAVPTPYNRFGELSPAQKSAISQQWGFDIEARKQRLQNLGGQSAAAVLSAQPQPDLTSKVMQINVTRPSPDAVGNAYEANNAAGISDYLWNGDIQLTNEQLSSLEVDQGLGPDPGARKKRQIRPLSTRWPNGIVYYFVDPSINARKLVSINTAINFLQNNTCLRFIYNQLASNRVRIYSGTGCFSTVGMVGGQQDVSLGDGCEAVGTAVHELMHALGVYHTQMRWDRDYYLSVSLAAVASNYRGNFATLKFTDAVQPSYTPFDWSSVMIYSANAFTNPSSNLSILPTDTRYSYGMGNTMVTFFDVKQINDHYNCSAACVAPTCAVCKNGGVPNPNDCTTCICPDGYAGPLCDQRPPDCGQLLNATTAWQNFGFTVGNTTNTSTRDDFTRCTYWISAPPGSQIQIQLTNMWNEQCSWGCLWAGVMFRSEWNQRITSPKLCCNGFLNQIFSSNLNPAPLIGYNRYYYSVFNFQFRYVPAPKLPPVGSYCANTLTSDQCVSNNAEAFCTNTTYTFQVRKYNCAQTCGFCGIAANPCVDLYSACSTALCRQIGDAMSAEYFCAKTCGFCDYPN